MDVHEVSSAVIQARCPWNSTGINLTRGQRYELHSEGTWTDLRQVSTADGYPSPNLLFRAVQWLRRERKADWFALIGSVDGPPKHRFRIGSHAIVGPDLTGELRCYANDLRFMYRNNHGSVTLTVTRIE